MTLIALDSLKTMQTTEIMIPVLDELSVVNICLNEFPDESSVRDDLVCFSVSFNDRICNYLSEMKNSSKGFKMGHVFNAFPRLFIRLREECNAASSVQ